MMIAKNRAKATEAKVIRLRRLLRHMFRQAILTNILTYAFHVLGRKMLPRDIYFKVELMIL